MARKKMLVAGASGLVGHAAVRHFMGREGWDVVGVSRRVPAGLESAALVSVDLTDRLQCAEVFGRMHDVTHVVYASLFEKPGLVQGWTEEDHVRTNQAMLENLLEPLEAAAPGLQHVSLLQGTKAYGVHVDRMRVPARERWPRHEHPNFYWTQQDWLHDRQVGKDWHWTVWRPQLILGESLGSNMNIFPALGVYAALLKAAGLPLSYPGGRPWVNEGVDTELLASAFEWAASAATARNEIFNITNGDVFVWQYIWPVIADAFGMEVGPDEPCSLVQAMADRDTEWAAIVDKYDLVAPRNLADFVGQSFALADFTLNYGNGGDMPAHMLVSTVKLRQAGFHEYLDTEDCFRKWIRRFQEHRLLPPRG